MILVGIRVAVSVKPRTAPHAVHIAKLTASYAGIVR